MSDVKYHAPGFARSHGLATSGKVNRGETWNPPPNPKPDDCLGVHSSATVGTKGRSAYPVVKGDTLYRAGVIACKKRAAQQGETEIEGAADKLLAIIDKDKAGASAVRTARVGFLRAPTAFSDKTVEVDEEAGVIKNVALLTAGPALGHPFEIDQTTVDQLVSLANAQTDGVKCRFKHPEVTEGRDADGNVVQRVADDTGSMIARIKNVRAVGAQARGDIYLGSYAETVPGMGNVREYLIRFAKDDPAGIGMSAFFSYHVDPEVDSFGNVVRCPARLETLDAIDVVGQAAANPNGLLSANSPAGWQDPKPGDPPRAPIPVSTPEFPHDVRGAYLAAIVKHGPLTLGGLAARFSGRLEQMRATADWLVSHGYAEKVPSGTMQAYNATPSGKTRIATTNLWRD